MKFLILFAALYAVTFAQETATTVNPPNCGRRPVVDGNVVGGQVSANGGHPHIISMEYGNGVTFSHSCGGSIINKRWVITAAHCVAGRPNVNNYRIQFGAHNRASASQNPWQISRSIDKIVSHPSYSSSTYKNDIALLRLSSPIEYDNNYILPACVHDGNVDQYTEGVDFGIAAGWGTTFSGGSVQTILRDVRLIYTTKAQATAHYGNSYDPVTMICFGIKGDNMDTCQGDSGGPVIIESNADKKKWILVGLTSWGYGCGDIGVYTRVSTYSNWIQQQLNANQP